MKAPEGLQFSSADHASEEEAFAAYAALYSGGADVERGPEPFFAEVKAWRLDKALLFDRRLGGLRHSRTTRVATDGFDHFTLTFVLEGRLSGRADERPFSIGAGEGVLLDMKRRMETEIPGTRMITVSLARSLVEAAAGSTGLLHGRILPIASSALLGDFLDSLARNASTMRAASLATVSRTLVDLLAVALDNGVAQVDRRRQNLARRASAQRVIDDRLGDPDLSPEALIEALGMSRASLYRLFADQGGIARFITERRLSAMRQRLEAGDPRSVDDLAKACGLTDADTAKRLFFTAFECDPEAFRPPPGDSEAPSVQRARRRWSAWMSEL